MRHSTRHVLITSHSKHKLIAHWKKTREGPEGALLLYTVLSAFKFPDNGQVYITCNVQVRREHRQQNK